MGNMIHALQDVTIYLGPFVYFHTSCVRTAKALTQARLSLRWSPM